MTSVTTPASVQTKRLVDTLTPEQKQAQINALLAELAAAKTSGEKKKIRRALRTRDFYLSRQPKADVVAVQAAETSKAGEAVANEIVETFGDGKGKKGSKKRHHKK